MVSATRYLKQHKVEAKKIEAILRQFGCSGDVPGFWCNKGDHKHLFDCVQCERDNYCPRRSPSLERKYNSHHQYRGDMALYFLMDDRPLGNQKDWTWLQHRETAYPQEVIS